MNDMRFSLAQLVKPIEVVGVACGEGARNKGCEAGPDAVRAGGLVPRLQMRGLSAAWRETIRPGHARHDDTLQAVRTVCRQTVTINWGRDLPLAQGIKFGIGDKR